MNPNASVPPTTPISVSAKGSDSSPSSLPCATSFVAPRPCRSLQRCTTPARNGIASESPPAASSSQMPFITCPSANFHIVPPSSPTTPAAGNDVPAISTATTPPSHHGIPVSANTVPVSKPTTTPSPARRRRRAGQRRSIPPRPPEPPPPDITAARAKVSTPLMTAAPYTSIPMAAPTRPSDTIHSPAGTHTSGGPIGTNPSTNTAAASSHLFGTPNIQNPSTAATPCADAAAIAPSTTTRRVRDILPRRRTITGPPMRSASRPSCSDTDSPCR